jgi:hypothetical protein
LGYEERCEYEPCPNVATEPRTLISGHRWSEHVPRSGVAALGILHARHPSRGCQAVAGVWRSVERRALLNRGGSGHRRRVEVFNLVER